MRTFRKAFGIACFAYAALAVLSFFKLVSVDTNLMAAGFIVMTAASLAIDAVVTRQEKNGAQAKASEPAS